MWFGPTQAVPKGVMKSNLVYLRPLRVAYVRSVGPYSQSSEDAWSRLFEWLNQNGLSTIPGCGYGLMLDSPSVTPEAECRYDACIEMSTLPENRAEGSLQVRKLPGGAYLRERHIGCYNRMRDSALKARENWAHSSGLSLDDKRPIVQIFLDDPRRSDAKELRSDVCVPVIAGFTASDGSTK